MLRKRGFTLLELMIAAGILVIAVSGVIALFVRLILSNESKSNMITAANDAQYVMEYIKQLDFDAIGTFNPDDLGIDNLPGESISITPPQDQDIEINLKNITVNVSWTERGGEKYFPLPTLIADTAKEE